MVQFDCDQNVIPGFQLSRHSGESFTLRTSTKEKSYCGERLSRVWWSDDNAVVTDYRFKGSRQGDRRFLLKFSTASDPTPTVGWYIGHILMAYLSLTEVHFTRLAFSSLITSSLLSESYRILLCLSRTNDIVKFWNCWYDWLCDTSHCSFLFLKIKHISNGDWERGAGKILLRRGLLHIWPSDFLHRLQSLFLWRKRHRQISTLSWQLLKQQAMCDQNRGRTRPTDCSNLPALQNARSLSILWEWLHGGMLFLYLLSIEVLRVTSFQVKVKNKINKCTLYIV